MWLASHRLCIRLAGTDEAKEWVQFRSTPRCRGGWVSVAPRRPQCCGWAMAPLLPLGWGWQWLHGFPKEGDGLWLQCFPKQGMGNVGDGLWRHCFPKEGMGNGSTAAPRLGTGNGSTASPRLGMGYGSTASLSWWWAGVWYLWVGCSRAIGWASFV